MSRKTYTFGPNLSPEFKKAIRMVFELRGVNQADWMKEQAERARRIAHAEMSDAYDHASNTVNLGASDFNLDVDPLLTKKEVVAEWKPVPEPIALLK